MQHGGVDPPFQIRSRVNSWRSVTLKIGYITETISIAPAKEMVERYFIERRAGSKSRDMAAYTWVESVSFDYHSHGIPADVASNPPFDSMVSRVRRFFLKRNRICLFYTYPGPRDS